MKRYSEAVYGQDVRKDCENHILCRYIEFPLVVTICSGFRASVCVTLFLFSSFIQYIDPSIFPYFYFQLTSNWVINQNQHRIHQGMCVCVSLCFVCVCYCNNGWPIITQTMCHCQTCQNDSKAEVYSYISIKVQDCNSKLLGINMITCFLQMTSL